MRSLLKSNSPLTLSQRNEIYIIVFSSLSSSSLSVVLLNCDLIFSYDLFFENIFFRFLSDLEKKKHENCRAMNTEYNNENRIAVVSKLLEELYFDCSC